MSHLYLLIQNKGKICTKGQSHEEKTNQVRDNWLERLVIDLCILSTLSYAELSQGLTRV